MRHPTRGSRAALLVTIAVAAQILCAAASEAVLQAATATQPAAGLCGAEQGEHAACVGEFRNGPEAGEPATPLPRSSSGRRPKTCVYAIALNERPNVQSFMDACKGADLVLVADTGSTDGTPDALRASGAEVHTITVKPWRFDSARNVALALLPADCDLCLPLDLDERLLPGWVEALQSAWASAGGLATAVQATYVDSWEPDGGTPATEFLQTKLHARGNYTWRGPAHELPYWTGAAGEERVVAAPALRIHHRPKTTSSRSSHLDLLKLGVDEDPTSARLAFHYGRELMGLQQHEAAIQELQRYLVLPGATWREERATALRYIAHCHQELQQLDESQAAAHRSVLEWGASREPWLALAHASRLLNDWPTCAWAATKALGITERTPSPFSDSSAWGADPHDELALASYHLGHAQQAVEEGEKALALDPGNERLQSNLNYYRTEAAATLAAQAAAVAPDQQTMAAATRWKDAPSMHILERVPQWARCEHKPCAFTEMVSGPVNREVPWRSQFGEDAWMFNNLFYEKRNGFYLEMGAMDGIQWSNTRWLQQAANWTGLLIEACPNQALNMMANRPESIGVHAAVCDEFKNVRWLSAGPVGGIFEVMPQSFKDSFHKGVDANSLPLLPCLPMQYLLDRYGIASIDFWSLDVEGGELEVLKTVDWSRLKVKVMIVELEGSVPEKDKAVYDLLQAQGFEAIKKTNVNWMNRLSQVFVHKQAWPHLARAPHIVEVVQ